MNLIVKKIIFPVSSHYTVSCYVLKGPDSILANLPGRFVSAAAATSLLSPLYAPGNEDNSKQ